MCIMLIYSHNLIVPASENSWTGEIATEFAGGDGTESNPYQIKTAEQLAYLAQVTNNNRYKYSNKYFSLMNDIDLNNIEWTPIGGYGATFDGFFNGNNYTVKNLKITEDKFDSLALINGDNIRYIWIGLFGYSYGTIENLNVTGAISINHSDEIYEDTIYVGGIAGRINQISNCNNFVTVSATSNSGGSIVYSGGLVGDYVSYADCCYNYGDIYAYAKKHSGSAGISGRGVYDDEGIKNSGNFGKIKAESPDTSRAGGIVSQVTYSDIENCFNKGEISASQVGGIASFISESTINNCYNSGDTISEHYNNYGYLAYKIDRSTLNNCFTTKSQFYISIRNSTTKKLGYVVELNSPIVFENDTEYTEDVTLLKALNLWVENNTDNEYKMWKQENSEFPILSAEKESEEKIYTTTKIENKQFVITPTNVPNGSTIIFVCYNDDRAVYVDTFTYAGEENKTFTPDKEYDEVKVIVWDSLSTLVPLCEAEKVTLN